MSSYSLCCHVAGPACGACYMCRPVVPRLRPDCLPADFTNALGQISSCSSYSNILGSWPDEGLQLPNVYVTFQFVLISGVWLRCRSVSARETGSSHPGTVRSWGGPMPTGSAASQERRHAELPARRLLRWQLGWTASTVPGGPWTPPAKWTRLGWAYVQPPGRQGRHVLSCPAPPHTTTPPNFVHPASPHLPHPTPSRPAPLHLP